MEGKLISGCPTSPTFSGQHVVAGSISQKHTMCVLDVRDGPRRRSRQPTKTTAFGSLGPCSRLMAKKCGSSAGRPELLSDTQPLDMPYYSGSSFCVGKNPPQSPLFKEGRARWRPCEETETALACVGFQLRNGNREPKRCGRDVRIVGFVACSLAWETKQQPQRSGGTISTRNRAADLAEMIIKMPEKQRATPPPLSAYPTIRRG